MLLFEMGKIQREYKFQIYSFSLNKEMELGKSVE